MSDIIIVFGGGSGGSGHIAGQTARIIYKDSYNLRVRDMWDVVGEVTDGEVVS